MIGAAIADISLVLWMRSVARILPLMARIVADCRRSVRWLSAGALVDSWQRMDRNTGQIQIPGHVAERDGLDFTWRGISQLNHIRPDVRVSHVLHFVANRTTHIFLAWRAAVLLLVLSPPVVCAAAPPPVSQIGQDTGGGFRLVDPVGPAKPIIPIELPSELPPPRPELAQSRGPTVPVDLIHQTLLDLLQLPEVSSDIAAAVKPGARRLGCFTAPGCGPCNQQKSEWGGRPALGGVEVTYYVRNDWTLPEWVPAEHQSFPCMFTMDTVGADGKPVYAYISGYRTWDQMWEFLAGRPPATSGEQLVGTVTLGSIKGKAQVAQALKLLNEMGPGQLSLSWQVAHAPKLGTADGGLEVDGAGSMTYRWDSDQMRLTFKPSLRLVSKTWVGRVSQPVSGVLVDRDKLTIEMPGMIDLAKRIVE